ncbi:IS3 family transposase [Salipaludibacillus agaradhaerens]|uniref:IS3 family transposase n=1 Tax=Salipaludibacillus agaradhaerens TaxID=76935 RepID=UPI002150CFD8|nr:IS3 family transposase [Salipaludibacillus agaradhaerens]MCR6109559.1 IS3 family transposase [Bacillus sp. A301a_S52]UJW56741.1 IS3 family transposase [Bacillus sp. A116_S68]MCR6106110.1 IS3 family transposase [Salipaludibacillus agaradhaerens]MCR6112622.1 IS3 family transposase [Bacillus sp. A301a_S52]MCR6118143.1 IS3 family transposase [Salipaludibacillus agaradhaerens]
MGRKNNVYPEEIKKEVIRLKLTGKYTNKELMARFGIKNKTQIKTWMRWYRKGEEQRLAQPAGKQYKYGKGSEDMSEIDLLKRKLSYYEMREDLLGKVPGNRKEVVPEAFVELVEIFKSKYTITMICDCLNVPKSTYYRWRKTSWKPKPLEQLVLTICKEFKYRVGHRMVRDLLKKEHHINANRNTVQKIMQKFNIQCRVKPKRQSYIAGESKLVVGNLLEQHFSAESSNQKWVTDITYLPYGEKMLYLSTIMDLYNNEIIAYRISDKQDLSLVINTLEDACRGRETYGVILHSDQGAQYTSYKFQEKAKEKGITTSMSRKGNCFDNAVIESFHSSLKSEEFSTQQRVHLTNSIVLEKVETYMYYYNYIRPFKKLNCHTPVEFRSMAA